MSDNAYYNFQPASVASAEAQSDFWGGNSVEISPGEIQFNIASGRPVTYNTGGYSYIPSQYYTPAKAAPATSSYCGGMQTVETFDGKRHQIPAYYSKPVFLSEYNEKNGHKPAQSQSLVPAYGTSQALAVTQPNQIQPFLPGYDPSSSAPTYHQCVFHINHGTINHYHYQ